MQEQFLKIHSRRSSFKLGKTFPQKITMWFLKMWVWCMWEKTCQISLSVATLPWWQSSWPQAMWWSSGPWWCGSAWACCCCWWAPPRSRWGRSCRSCSPSDGTVWTWARSGWLSRWCCHTKGSWRHLSHWWPWPDPLAALVAPSWTCGIGQRRRVRGFFGHW